MMLHWLLFISFNYCIVLTYRDIPQYNDLFYFWYRTYQKKISKTNKKRLKSTVSLILKIKIEEK